MADAETLLRGRDAIDRSLDTGALPAADESAAKTIHVPWWHFAQFHERLPLAADVVICDAALGEMDRFAFLYVTRIAKMLAARSDVGCVLFQNIGEERVQNRAYVDTWLASIGFRLMTIGGVNLFA